MSDTPTPQAPPAQELVAAVSARQKARESANRSDYWQTMERVYKEAERDVTALASELESALQRADREEKNGRYWAEWARRWEGWFHEIRKAAGVAPSPNDPCESVAEVVAALQRAEVAEKERDCSCRTVAHGHTSDTVARLFHDAYETHAPAHRYKTREASAVPWADVPENNKALMRATVAEVFSLLGIPLVAAPTDERQDAE